MSRIPKTCYECKESIVVVKCVLLYCDCCTALCPQCAYKQLAKHTVAPYLQYISCPSCKGVLSDLDTETLMKKIEAARKREELALETAVKHFRLGDYEILMLCDAIQLYHNLIEKYRSIGYLYDVVIEGASEHYLRTCVVRAEMSRVDSKRKKE